MTLDTARRLQSIRPSATVAITMKAAELRAAGRDILALAAGEPDFDTPAHVRAAAIAAIEGGDTRYTAVDGTPRLKAAVRAFYARRLGLTFSDAEIIVSGGAKPSIFNCLIALLNAGDEVIVPAPHWVSYPDMVALAGGRAVIVAGDASRGFRIDAGRLAAHITPRTRMLVLNAPCNPTGQVYSREELAALAEVLATHPRIAILSDDIYDQVYWGAQPLSNILEVAPALRERTILVNGVSKAYAMTGWRIGYAVGPEAVLRAMRKVQGQSSSNPCSVSQAAAVAALEGPQDCVREMAQTFRRRHDRVVSALNELRGVSCLPAEGAFYAFADCRELLRRCPWAEDDVQLAEALLERAGVASVPGSAFGGPGHLRFSYATSDEDLARALERLADFAASF